MESSPRSSAFWRKIAKYHENLEKEPVPVTSSSAVMFRSFPVIPPVVCASPAPMLLLPPVPAPLPPPPPLVHDSDRQLLRVASDSACRVASTLCSTSLNWNSDTNSCSPLANLNFKFGEGFPLRFKSAKIDFSIPTLSKPDATSQEPDQSKASKCRGRPSANYLKKLHEQGSHTQRYVCQECQRSFPRKKSLDTHILTHTDLKPYKCDFPGCARSFKQSGQLKTHVRLHTGEKPFCCVVPQCTSAFAHANRKCPRHPDLPLKRVASQLTIPPHIYADLLLREKENQGTAQGAKVRAWFRKQLMDRDLHCSSDFEQKQSLPKKICLPQDRKPLQDMSVDYNYRVDGIFNPYSKVNQINKVPQPDVTAQEQALYSAYSKNSFFKQLNENSLSCSVDGRHFSSSLGKLAEKHSESDESRKRLMSAMALVELQSNKYARYDH